MPCSNSLGTLANSSVGRARKTSILTLWSLLFVVQTKDLYSSHIIHLLEKVRQAPSPSAPIIIAELTDAHLPTLVIGPNLNLFGPSYGIPELTLARGLIY
jgi:hypothetical protein